MNAKQLKDQTNSVRDLNFALIPLEKAEQPSLWSRLRKAFATPDLTLESWERLEMKRSPSSFNSQQRRNF